MSDTHTIIDVVEHNGQAKAHLNYTKIFSAGFAPTFGTETQPKPTISIQPAETQTGFMWAPWGDRLGNDDLPRRIRERVFDVAIAGRTIYDLVRMAYGNGIAYYSNRQRQETGAIDRHFEPKIENFIQDNFLGNEWLKPQLINYRFFMNTFSEMILNKRKDQITNIFHKEAEYCRLSLQNPKTFTTDFLLYSADFSLGRGNVDPDRINAIYLCPKFNGPAFIEQLPGFKFAWHSRLKTPGSFPYALPFWLGLFRDGGWMDVSKAVSEVVHAMMHNQVRLKYQILIPEDYFTIRYRDSWQTMTDKGRQDKIDELVDDINAKLSGTKNAFVSISTIFQNDGVNGEKGKIEIVAIDDKIKKDSWVPSSEKSDAQVVQGLGGHPSMVGLAPEGGKMGAGSGSDKREVFNTEITNNTFDQEVILEQLQFVANFNRLTDPAWDVTFYIDHTFHTTTNEQETGLVTGENVQNSD